MFSTILLAASLATPPCQISHQARVANTVYIACPGGLLLVVEVDGETGVERERSRLDGEIVGFHRADGQLWVELSRRSARPIAALNDGPNAQPVPPAAKAKPIAPVETKATAPAAEAKAEGQVVAIQTGRLVLNIGSEAGLKRDGRVEIFQRNAVALGESVRSIEEESTLVVGRVVAAAEGRAIVSLGRNEQAPVGSQARPTKKALTAIPHLPPRVGNITEVGFTARPYLALGTIGGGVLTEIYARHRGSSPWFVEGSLSPLGIGIGKPGKFLTTTAKVVAGFDGDVLAVGLGLGVPYFTWEDTRHVSRLLIPQYARLGASDGAHLLVEPLFEVGEEEITFFGMTGQLQAPVGLRTWVLLRGGGGPFYGFGEVGVRHLLKGNGTHDSLIVSVSTGGGAIFGLVPGDVANVTESFAIGGPMVGGGLEWRL